MHLKTTAEYCQSTSACCKLIGSSSVKGKSELMHVLCKLEVSTDLFSHTVPGEENEFSQVVRLNQSLERRFYSGLILQMTIFILCTQLTNKPLFGV